MCHRVTQSAAQVAAESRVIMHHPNDPTPSGILPVALLQTQPCRSSGPSATLAAAMTPALSSMCVPIRFLRARRPDSCTPTAS
jgi:hypothetical protein